MGFYKKIRILTIFILAFTIVYLRPYLLFAQIDGKPGLLVTPTRAILEGKKRSASISIANNGNRAGSYKLQIVNRRMKEDGTIVKVDKASEEEVFANQILRVSPRRVYLEPGEHQNVRILARKPKDLPDGEYRSHLNFSIVPEDNTSQREKDNNEKKPEGDTLTISIKANFGLTIPVIVRHGNLSVKGLMGDITLKKEDDGINYISFPISREGNKSLYGDIRVNYTNGKGEEYVLKSMGGLAVYTPNKKRIFNIPLNIPKGVKINKGHIEVIYREKEKDGGEVIASNKLKL